MFVSNMFSLRTRRHLSKFSIIEIALSHLAHSSVLPSLPLHRVLSHSRLTHLILHMSHQCYWLCHRVSYPPYKGENTVEWHLVRRHFFKETVLATLIQWHLPHFNEKIRVNGQSLDKRLRTSKCLPIRGATSPSASPFLAALALLFLINGYRA